MFKIRFTLLCLIGWLTASYIWGQSLLQGVVVSATDHQSLPFATCLVPETGQGTIADETGRFQMRVTAHPPYSVRVQSLGFQTQTLAVTSADTTLTITLSEQSITLSDFTVTARYLDQVGSSATIGQEALEYIQPTSLNDVFSLLPGGTMGASNMQQGRLITNRQAGSDRSTSFGMGVSVNGIPLRNDGMRIQMEGETGQDAADQAGNVAVNTGMDLRTLSTDHVESITVVRGISPASEGNLSSGSVRLQAKQGASPLRVRVKYDPQNKLVYAGKGYKLPAEWGTLHVGADIVHSQAQIEDSRGAYNRATAQGNWSWARQWWGRPAHLNLLGSFVSSFSNNKTDPLISAYHEKYRSRYQRASLSFKADHEPQLCWLDKMELQCMADYTLNRLEYHKHVINRSVMPLQQSITEGESEGIYLPSNYDTFYELDNLPLTGYAQLTAHKYGLWGQHLHYTFDVGASATVTKNVGLGAVVDAERPPFPSADFIRPRRNRDIPAIAHQASFVETRLSYTQEHQEWHLSAGLRQTTMLNLPKDYYLHGRLLFEPRLQGSYTWSHQAGGHSMSHTWRLGYGEENKLPSADYLYPDRVYHDYIALNAYYTEADRRLLITNTKIQDPTNPALRADRNRKYEAGYDCKWHDFELNVTLFDETMRGGVEYFTSYMPTSYTYYYQLRHEVAGKPTRDDFLSRTEKTFMAMRSPANSARTDKQGIEYRLHTPTLPCLHSDFEINGAWYHTVYSSGIPVMYRPSIMVDDHAYPYVGIYDGHEREYADMGNTNLWVNTHLTDWRLIFTNFIQVVWLQESHLGTDVSEYPERYMDTSGNIHPFNLGDDTQLERLRRSFLSARYNRNKMPVSVIWNIKATKECGRHVRIAFFANHLLQVSPTYRDAYQRTRRNSQQPFFGGELTWML